MAAAKTNLTLEEGATWNLSISWMEEDGITPVDLTSWTARMQVRKSYTAPPLVTLTDQGGITMDDQGIITLHIDADDSVGWKKGRYLYDLELTAQDGTVVRLLQGKFTVVPEVTKDSTT